MGPNDTNVKTSINKISKQPYCGAESNISQISDEMTRGFYKITIDKPDLPRITNITQIFTKQFLMNTQKDVINNECG